MGGSKKKRALQKKTLAAHAAAPAATQASPGFFLRIQSRWNTIARTTARWHIILEILAVACIFALGVFSRLEDIPKWREIESRTFYDSKPIHTTFDAWFYLSLAQDLIDETYTQPDEKRGVPHSPPRPEPAPLISVLAAGIVNATSYSLCWVGAVLPAVLGPLLVIPLYMIGRFYGGVVCGLLASLVSVLYPFFISRSNFGRFDTDCMILTFSLGAVYLFMQFGLNHTRLRYFYLCSGMLLSGLFLWWWDQTQAAVFALTGLPLIVALVFFYRPKRREGLIFYSIFLTSVIAAIMIIDPALPLRIFERLWREFLYISKDQSGSFPNVGNTISEQGKSSLADIIKTTTTGTAPFLFAAAGFLLLIWRRKAHVVFLLPFIVMTFLALNTANRFILFMIPLVALGTGYAAAAIWLALRKTQPLNSLIIIGIAVFLCIPLLLLNARDTRMPKEPGYMVKAMYTIREKTPEDAVIWAWWDHGYALTYYARRATINDGSIHAGELTVLNAIPYSTDSFRLAANFMHFYVMHGMTGIRRINRQLDNDPAKGLQFIKTVLKAGPVAARTIIDQAGLKPEGNCTSTDDWLKFFFPGPKRPVYLVCDSLLNRIAYWWYWFGTWDIASKDGTHPQFKAYQQISFNNTKIQGSDNLAIDRTAGTFIQNNRELQLSGIALYSRSVSRTLNDYNRPGLRFEFNREHRNGAIMDAQIADSVFSRLFIRVQPDSTYFKPVINSPPYIQLWEVFGDSFNE
jgi:dolichyl-diphosphooligosaccharide--protein glycosyltransferase